MKLPGFVTKTAFSIGKSSPTILITVGVLGAVASAVGACVQTHKKLDAVLETHERYMEGINNEELTEATDNDGNKFEIDAKMRKKLRINARLKLAWELTKIYGIPALGMAASIACIVGAQIILRRRNAILTASLATCTKAFEEYRKRVADRFGDEVERQIHYNMIPDGDPVTVIDVDENGKTHKSKVQNFAIDPDKIVPEDGVLYFTRGYSDLWRDDDATNEVTIENIIAFIKSSFTRGSHVFLNDICRDFGIEGTINGQALGLNEKDGDVIDIRYSAQRFIDPLNREGGSIGGYVVEIVGLHNILDTVFTKRKNEIVAV